MKFFSKKNNTNLIAILFITLVISILVLIQRFDDFTLKTNLMAFQKREMQSTVNNYINVIDHMRNDMIDNMEKNGLEYSEEDIKQATLTFMRHVIHETDFVNGAYLWINEVINFDGGDNYAIRQVHGNLKDTEGIFLSTSTPDAQGNLPYLEELNGIKENGEIFYNYYFKEYHSDNISEKVTYAKLYEPYNWIVCTGTYLNSLYDPAGGVSNHHKIVFYTICIILLIFSLLLFTHLIVSNILSSRKLIQETEVLKGKINKDSLSGAYSRTFGNKLLKEYFNNFTTCGRNYSLAILDIDNFKSINDKYGHPMGDCVIKNMVKTFQDLQNVDDHIIRWGGDEFILTFSDIDEDLKKKLGKLNKTIANQIIITEKGEKFQYTISIGASTFNEKDNTINDTIKRIDDALYLAKRNKNSFYIIR